MTPRRFARECSGTFSVEERADVFANPRRHGDREAALARDVEVASRPDFKRSGCPVEDHLAISRDNLHAFRCAGAEVILAGENEAEGLLGSVWKADGMGHDAAFKINVGFGLDGNIGKGRGIHWIIGWGWAANVAWPAMACPAQLAA